MDRNDMLAAIVAEWRGERERGGLADKQAYVDRHPKLAEALRARFEAIELLEQRYAGRKRKRVGPYHLIREIGRGGMGVVYEAEQVSMRRRVALKVLYPSVTNSPKAVKRFRQEAWAAGRLKHTNIVAVHDLGQDQDIWYAAMELVEGRPLDAVIATMREGRRQRRATKADRPTSTLTGSPSGTTRYYRRVAEMFAEVANALQVAHDHGVLHRDLKPANLLLDVEGRLKLVDFGLARLEDAVAMTVTGDVLGTPLYMSPEQLAGPRDAVGRQSDVYSLGATLYETLVLRAPFESQTLPGLTARILKAEPKPLQRWDETIPKDLETIVLKALEKDPARRYVDAAALERDLRQFSLGGTIGARRIGPLGRTWRRMKRHKVRSALVGVVLLVATSAALLGLRASREAELRRGLEYEAIFRRAEAAASKEWGVREDLSGTVDREAGALRLYSEAIARVPERWEAWFGRALVRSERTYEERMGDLDAALARGVGARLYHLTRAHLLLDAAKGRESAASVRETALAAALPEGGAMEDFLVGRIQLARGRWKEAEAALSRAISRTPEAQSLRHFAHIRRGIAREELQDYEGALADWLYVRESIGDESLETRIRIASLWRRFGQKERAREIVDEALAEARKTATAAVWDALATACLLADMPDLAREVTAEALTAFPQDLPLLRDRMDACYMLEDAEGLHEVTARILMLTPRDWHARQNAGLAYLWENCWAKAIEQYDLALKERPDSADTWVNRAVSLANLDRADEAMVALDKALESVPHHAAALAQKGLVLIRQGNYQEALAAADKAIEFHPGLAWAHRSRSAALRRLRRPEEAEASAARAVKLDPRSETALTEQAKVLRDLQRFDEAVKALRAAVERKPDAWSAWVELARLQHDRLGRPDLAAQAWEQVLRCAPDWKGLEAHFRLGEAYWALGRLPEALKQFGQGLEVAKPEQKIERGQLHSNRGAILQRLGRHDEALAAHRAALENAPGEAPVRHNLANTLLTTGQPAEALPHFDATLRIDPSQIAAHYGRALALVQLQKPEEALLALETYTRLAPTDPDGHYEQARILKALGRLEEAERVATALVQAEPARLRNYVLRGDIRVDRNELAGAREDYAAFLDGGGGAEHLAPGALYAIWLNRGFASLVLRRFEEADRCMRESLRLRESWNALMGMAQLYAECPDARFRDPAKALAWARRAHELSRNPGTSAVLGRCLVRNGRWQEAYDNLEEAMAATGGGDATDRLLRAIAAWHLGKWGEARTLHAQAATMIAGAEKEDLDAQALQREVRALIGEAR